MSQINKLVVPDKADVFQIGLTSMIIFLTSPALTDY